MRLCREETRECLCGGGERVQVPVGWGEGAGATLEGGAMGLDQTATCKCQLYQTLHPSEQLNGTVHLNSLSPCLVQVSTQR